MYDARIKCPATILLSGPSQSGKTSLVHKMLLNGEKLFSDGRCIQNILYFYKEWQTSYGELKDKMKVEFINRLPRSDEIRNKTESFKELGGSIVVIDDFMQDLSKDTVEIFTALSHHLNITVMLLVQNLFSKNPQFRDISLNSSYVIVFKNPRDASQISFYARQYAPGDSKAIVELFRRVTKDPYSYLLFDNHQLTPDAIRLRSNLLGENEPLTVWSKIPPPRT